jgi:hypothetical protein
MKVKAGLLLVMVAGVMALSVLLRADEEKVPLDKVPKAALKAVKDKYPRAKLLGADKEKENGKTVYEIQIEYKDHNIDVTVTPEGKILSAEKTIKEREVPEAVTKAFKAKYPKAKIKKIEEISKDADQVTAYEYLIEFGKKKLEVKFDPKGKFLAEENKDKEEKEKKKDKKEKEGS